MARGDQLSRQWKIIRTLIASKRGKSVQDLANSLACHPRTVYRDLEALQMAGFPIYSEKIDHKSCWSFLDSRHHPIPIPFNITELMALYFSRDVLKILKNTLFHNALESLFQKVKSTLQPEHLRYLRQLEKSLQVGFHPYKKYGELKDLFRQINDAVVNKRHLRIRYYSMGRKKESRRVVAPYKLWFFDGSFYMLGYCRLRDDIRLFALDRIKSYDLLDTTFETPHDFDIEDLLRSSFGAYLGKPVRLVVRFSSKVAGYIQEKIWHQSQVIEQVGDGSILFKADVAAGQEIKFWIMKWGAEALVLEPDSLRREIEAEAAAIVRKYNQG